MEELLVNPGEVEAAAAAAKAELEQSSAVPETDGAETLNDFNTGTEPTVEDLPESGFWENDEPFHAPAESTQESVPESPEIQEAKEQAEAAFKYRANGVDKEISADEARKILSRYDGNEKGFQIAAKTQRQLKALQKQISALQDSQSQLDQIRSLKDNPAGLVEAVTGKSMKDLIQAEVERRNQWELASPEERARIDLEQRQAEINAKLAEQEERLKQREQELENQASSHHKETLNEKFKSAMAEYYSPNSDPTVDNDLRDMVWGTSVRKIRNYHKEGYEISDKLINAVFKKVSRSLGTHRNANINQEISKISSEKSEVAKQQAQQAATKNYAPSPELPNTKRLNPLEIFETFVKRRKA